MRTLGIANHTNGSNAKISRFNLKSFDNNLYIKELQIKSRYIRITSE